jgi:hypothetical protein
MVVRQLYVFKHEIECLSMLISTSKSNIGARRGPGHYPSRSLTLLQQLFAGDTRTDDVPLTNLRQARRDSAVRQDPNDEETERHL